MIIETIIVTLLIGIATIQNLKVNKLEHQLEIIKSENISLKMVMAENGLIPKKFVK